MSKWFRKLPIAVSASTLTFQTLVCCNVNSSRRIKGKPNSILFLSIPLSLKLSWWLKSYHNLTNIIISMTRTTVNTNQSFFNKHSSEVVHFSCVCDVKSSDWKGLTCYSKAPFVKVYSVIHKMCYNLHGSAFGLDYTGEERGRKGERRQKKR